MTGRASEFIPPFYRVGLGSPSFCCSRPSVGQEPPYCDSVAAPLSWGCRRGVAPAAAIVSTSRKAPVRWAGQKIGLRARPSPVTAKVRPEETSGPVRSTGSRGFLFLGVTDAHDWNTGALGGIRRRRRGRARDRLSRSAFERRAPRRVPRSAHLEHRVDIARAPVRS